MEKLEQAGLKFPEMRSELIDYLVGLSDRQYQFDCWVKKRCSKDIENDELDYAVHFLFDDTNLASDPVSTIGEILINRQEAYLIQSVCKALSEVFSRRGYDRPDIEYIESPEWELVLISANEALASIKAV